MYGCVRAMCDARTTCEGAQNHVSAYIYMGGHTCVYANMHTYVCANTHTCVFICNPLCISNLLYTVRACPSTFLCLRIYERVRDLDRKATVAKHTRATHIPWCGRTCILTFGRAACVRAGHLNVPTHTHTRACGHEHVSVLATYTRRMRTHQSVSVCNKPSYPECHPPKPHTCMSSEHISVCDRNCLLDRTHEPITNLELAQTCGQYCSVSRLVRRKPNAVAIPISTSWSIWRSSSTRLHPRIHDVTGIRRPRQQFPQSVGAQVQHYACA